MKIFSQPSKFAGLVLIMGSTLLFAAEEDGFKSLFNGKDLTGWDGNPELWSVRDGAITGQTTAEKPTKGNTFLFWRDGLVDDFELRLRYRVIGNNPDKWANSGVQYRSVDKGNWVASGYQADIEAGTNYSGIMYEEGGRGILALRGQQVVVGNDGKPKVVGSLGKSEDIQAAIKSEDWNEYTITAQGFHLVHQINGRTTMELTDEHVAKRMRSGILALQLHAGQPMTIQFKDIRLKRLPMADVKKIVMVAGAVSHGAGDHEHNAGVLLWKQCLDKVDGVVTAAYTRCNGWPQDPTAFDNADALVFFMDGGDGNALIRDQRLAQLGELMKKSVGLACVHYTLEVPKDRGGAELLKWVGGFYETGYSTNPSWKADFTTLPDHPITRGVKPFALMDEWYYHLRLAADQPGFTPLLKAVPPDNNRGTAAAKDHPGRAEVVSWAFQRPDGGRGFGFTGGHYHTVWGDENNRRLLLNAFLWTARAEVPVGGVSSVVTSADLARNLDAKEKK